MRSREETEAIYRRNVDAVYRVCMLFFHGRRADAEDAAQTAFVKLMKSEVRFVSKQQERAFCIVTAGNVCKDMLKSAWMRRVDFDEERLNQIEDDTRTDELLELVMALPSDCKTAIYLHYYEGYPAAEIARYMGKSTASVWGYLHRGRKLLRRAFDEEA